MQNMRFNNAKNWNLSKYKIEQLSVYLTCENFKYNIKFMCRSKSLHCT